MSISLDRLRANFTLAFFSQSLLYSPFFGRFLGIQSCFPLPNFPIFSFLWEISWYSILLFSPKISCILHLLGDFLVFNLAFFSQSFLHSPFFGRFLGIQSCFSLPNFTVFSFLWEISWYSILLFLPKFAVFSLLWEISCLQQALLLHFPVHSSKIS